jgi:hypothetical protein
MRCSAGRNQEAASLRKSRIVIAVAISMALVLSVSLFTVLNDNGSVRVAAAAAVGSAAPTGDYDAKYGLAHDGGLCPLGDSF